MRRRIHACQMRRRIPAGDIKGENLERALSMSVSG
jgi:hypothetical protein